MADEDADARSEESFQSADDDDDFDLPQDLGVFEGGQDGGDLAASSADGGGAAASSGGAQPPGFDESGDAGAAERWNLKKDGNKEQLEPIWTRLSADREHIKISKMFSYVLRHAAHKLDVRIRKDGFVRLREIMKLRNFKPYTLEELMAVVYFDEKERYTMVREFDGELLIRANQGHTMKVVEDDLLLETITDTSTVSECVHGTYLVHWPFIKRQGLSKVARNHIHLANGLPEDGKIRGMRQSAELFVYVDVPKAMLDGVVFYRSKNEVILTQGVDGWLPPKYFVKAVRIDYNTCDIEEMEFDRETDMPTWPAELAPSGPGEQGTYLIKNLEALISNCKKRLHEINELKALQEQDQELEEDDIHKISMHAQVYTELQSLEQRFRQHKGHRKESAQDKEARMKEEAEAVTVVKRKDRAVTPPWEKGRQVESTSMKATEKEKAEWAALGRRRDSAPTPQQKRDDPWSALGRGRQDGPSGATPKDAGKRPTFSKSGSFGGSFGIGREDSKSLSTPSGGGGPPRFFNSKKSTDGPSWRDRMSGGHGSKDFDDIPSARKADDDFDEPSWRAPAPSHGSQVPPPAQPPQVRQIPSLASVPPPPTTQAPTAVGMAASSPADANGGHYMQQVPMWQGQQMCGGYGGGQQVYYMASPQGQDSGGWMGQQMPPSQPQQQMVRPMHQQMPQMQPNAIQQRPLPQEMGPQMHQPMAQGMQPQMSPMQTSPMQYGMQQQQPQASPMHQQMQQQPYTPQQRDQLGLGSGYGGAQHSLSTPGGGMQGYFGGHDDAGHRGASSSFAMGSHGGGFCGGGGCGGGMGGCGRGCGGGACGGGYDEDSYWNQEFDSFDDGRGGFDQAPFRKGGAGTPSGKKGGGGGGCKGGGGAPGGGGGGKGGGRGGGFGKDRGDSEAQDWAALGRMRAAA